LIYGRCLGSLWATFQNPHFDGHRLALVVPCDPLTGVVGGPTVVALDLVGCRAGDDVLVVYEGSSCRLALDDPDTPCEAIVVGIVDSLDLESPKDVEGAAAKPPAPAPGEGAPRSRRRSSPQPVSP
jgi:ethanolamine utilization protein EutN